jgi:zinc transporter, ZIP family
MATEGHRDRAGATDSPRLRAPAWALALVPLALIAVAIVVFATFGGATLGERRGPPLEELAVERTVLRPGAIELTVRNAGPDPVQIGQVAVNDAFVGFDTDTDTIDRLGSGRLTLDYPWQEGSPYLVSLLTSAGGTIEHEIPLAVETPQSDGGFYGLMALLGTYVGIIPVALGMLFLPLLRRVRETWIRAALAVTVGLLAFLAVDGYLEGLEIGEGSSGAFGGAELLFLGAGLAYLALTGVDRWLQQRRAAAETRGIGGWRVALMIAIGIGLHNLGEGLAIGSAYAVGALALGAFLVIGFAVHNTTEGLAIAAPLARESRVSLRRLAGLGAIAGAPTIPGAALGASVSNPELSVLLIGLGVGAIVQVIVQIAPALKDRGGHVLHPVSVGGIGAGVLAMYLTGMLVSV